MVENDIKKLIKILEESNIDEIEVSTLWGKQNIRIKKQSIIDTAISTSTSAQNNNIERAVSSSKGKKILTDADKLKEDDNPEVNINADNSTSEEIITIKAPLVGTFYLSPKPGADPFIEVGENISTGQIICIVEAMKIFNEIESEYDGKIIKILVDDGSPIEFDQPLILISPN